MCEATGRELLPKNIEGTRAKLKRLVRLDVLTEADADSFSRKQQPPETRNQRPASTSPTSGHHPTNRLPSGRESPPPAESFQAFQAIRVGDRCGKAR
jgi:hypothetical protein